MPKKILLISLLILYFIANVRSQKNIEKYNCFSIPVKINNQQKQNFEGLLLLVNYSSTIEPEMKLCNVYFLQESENHILCSDSTALGKVYDAKISDDSKKLALLFCAEGHTWVEIIDVENLLQNNDFKVIDEIIPYPGDIELYGWKNEELIVKSNILLTKKNNGNSLSENDLLQNYQFFMYNSHTKKYK